MQAYNTLSKPRARQAYDKQLEVALKDHEDGYTGADLPSVCAWEAGTLLTALLFRPSADATNKDVSFELQCFPRLYQCFGLQM